MAPEDPARWRSQYLIALHRHGQENAIALAIPFAHCRGRHMKSRVQQGWMDEVLPGVARGLGQNQSPQRLIFARPGFLHPAKCRTVMQAMPGQRFVE